MAFVLTTYTTYADIRALLGVASKELTDTVLALETLALSVKNDVMDLDTDGGLAISQYTTIVAIVEASRTATQQRFYEVMRLYVAYCAARHKLGDLDMAAPQEITDGRAKVVRSAKQSAALREAITANWTALRTRLSELLAELEPTAEVPAALERTTILASAINLDPVTNA